ncbi:MAG: T9SS type A sorting domain-containing protein [Saprospiraceae bacterium]|nr:T9SS type A sorting domain-containing protein [Saprospiraceae bacterium]
MSLKKYFILIICLYASSMIGQHVHSDRCGVSIEDQQLNEKIHPNDFKGNSNRNAIIYIPIKFHITANTDGTGRLETVHVLNQLCILNQDYEKSNMVFYIYEGINFINQTNIYQNPGLNPNAVQAKKNNRAVNVFITENANTQEGSIGTVLGFYSPQGDYIIIRKKELADQSNILSHEIGHFFNLRHTFYGWEGVPYDKTKHGETVTFNTVPGGIEGIAVELVNGSNCTTAADLICDTPPDYNFGLTAGNCVFNKIVFDKNGDKVVPMKNNQMSYFSNCDTFKFTEGQSNRMFTSVNSSSRAYLRANYTPNTTEIVSAPSFLTPQPSEKIDMFNNVKFDWEDVPGASNYLIEIRGQCQYIWSIVKKSEYTSTELKKNSFYSWSVKPYNEGNSCSISKSSIFKTGDGTVSINDETEYAQNFIQIVPNPVQKGGVVTVVIKNSIHAMAEISIFSVYGISVFRKEQTLISGTNNVEINLPFSENGIYFLNTNIAGHNTISKFIIQ